MPEHPARPISLHDPSGTTEHLNRRLTVLERLSEERWSRLDLTLSRLEAALTRLDRRLWLAATSLTTATAGLAAGFLWDALIP